MGAAMTGLKRSHMCCDVSENLIGSEETVMAWVQTRRDLGQLIFISLSDTTLIVQALVDAGTMNYMLTRGGEITLQSDGRKLDFTQE